MKISELLRKGYVLDAIESINFNAELQQVYIVVKVGYYLTAKEIRGVAENHLRNLIAA